MNKVVLFLVIFIITLFSGISDSQGFLHASNIWKDNRLVFNELLKSSLGFVGGIISYWVSIRYLQAFGIITPEFQTVGWLLTTIIGVSLVSGRFLHWQISNQILAVVIVICFCVLIFRTNN